MPDDHELIREGIKLRRMGHRKKAREIFASILLNNPLQGWARYELVDEYLDQGEIDLAVQTAIEGVNLPRPSAQLICKVAEIMGKVGNFSEQDKYLQLATRKFPHRAYPWIQMAMNFKGRGNFDLAVETLRIANATCGDRDQRDLIAEAFAQIRSLETNGNISTAIWPPQKGSAIQNACVVQLIKDEQDIILDQLEHNFQLGFRFFCIIDNQSSDQTLERIYSFIDSHSDAIVVTIQDRVKQHYQDFKTSAAAKFAVEYFKPLGCNIEWIFPLDADEFISFSNEKYCLRDILEISSASRIISLQLINCASTVPLSEYPKHGIYSCFPLVDLVSHRGVIKCAYRYSHDARPTLGNHFVTNSVDSFEQITTGSDLGLYIRHFPYRSVSHTKSKVVNGYKAIVEHPDVLGGGHWRQNWELYNRHGDAWIERHLLNYINRVKNQNS